MNSRRNIAAVRNYLVALAIGALPLATAGGVSADVTKWPIGSGGGGGCSSYLAVDGSGNVYANDSDIGRFRKWTSDGTGGAPFGPVAAAGPIGAAKAPDGGIYIGTSSGLAHYSASGASIGTIALSGGPGIDFYRGFATDSSGRIYGLSLSSSQVVRYSSSGAFEVAWGSAGEGPGEFDFYSGRGFITADGDGNVYVGDASNRIQMFTASGSFVRQWGGSGSSASEFNWLWGLAADSDGHIYAGEFGSGQGVVPGIRRFSTSGTYLGSSNTWWQSSALATYGSNLVFQTGCRDIYRYDLTKPSAEVSAKAANMLPKVGDTVTVTAKASVPFGSITSYAFDLDGDGSYETRTDKPEVTTTFSTAGKKTVRVQATSDRGGEATASAEIEVYPLPPPAPTPPKGPTGISINDGAYATNDEAVTINATWPYGALAITLSNDGGFKESGGAKTFDVTSSIPWKLRTMSSGQLTRIVYARFYGDQTYSDDIVLDKTAPVLSSATSSGASSSAAAARKYKVTITASQKRSGVSSAQFSAKRSGGQTVILKNRKQRGFVKLKKTVSVRTTSPPRFVRVQSAAGTWSKWKAIKRK